MTAGSSLSLAWLLSSTSDGVLELSGSLSAFPNNHGHLGTSLANRMAVGQVIRASLPATIELGCTGLLLRSAGAGGGL